MAVLSHFRSKILIQSVHTGRRQRFFYRMILTEHRLQFFHPLARTSFAKLNQYIRVYSYRALSYFSTYCDTHTELGVILVHTVILIPSSELF